MQGKKGEQEKLKEKYNCPNKVRPKVKRAVDKKSVSCMHLALEIICCRRCLEREENEEKNGRGT